MGKKALVSALAAALAATAAHAASECCSTCIGKSGGTYTYDPAVYDQCEPVGGICCFGCDSLGSPVFGDAVSYASDGVTAVAKTGVYITFTWANAVNVTYVALKSGQKKTVTPSYSDSLATDDDGTFKICPSSTGTIYFRGWGSDPCTESSVEQNVTIEAGDSSTCDGSSTTDSDTEKSTSKASGSASASGSAGSSSANVESCNANRGSIQEVDGVKTCVCVSDWTNPPECDQWPVWKWIVTIGGGVAAFFSILLSIRAFIKSREKKDADKRDSADPPILQKDVDTLQVTPSREHKHEPLAMPVAYKRDSDIDYLPPSNAQPQPAAQKDHREFAL